MKKYLFVLAAAVVALASCTGGGNKYTSLKFKNAEVTVAQGESVKLYLIWEPTSLNAPTCEWSSSDTTVAKVDQNGNVTGVASGIANITAKLDNLQAACQVTVKDQLDLMSWAGWTIWNFDDETPLTDTIVIELSIGPTKCMMYPATAFVWDENIVPTYNEKGQMTGLSGLGYVMEIYDMPIYVIKDGSEYDGYYVNSSLLQLVDPAKFNPTDTAYAYCAPAGKLGDAQKFYTYLMDTTAHIPYEECMTGTEVSIIDWDAPKGYYWFGLAGPGIIQGDEESIYYKVYVNWFENQTGLVMDENGDLVAPGIWGKITDKYYENIPEPNAAKKLTPKKPVKRDIPQFLKNRKKMDNKVLINNK